MLTRAYHRRRASIHSPMNLYNSVNLRLWIAKSMGWIKTLGTVIGFAFIITEMNEDILASVKEAASTVANDTLAAGAGGNGSSGGGGLLDCDARDSHFTQLVLVWGIVKDDVLVSGCTWLWGVLKLGFLWSYFLVLVESFDFYGRSLQFLKPVASFANTVMGVSRKLTKGVEADLVNLKKAKRNAAVILDESRTALSAADGGCIREQCSPVEDTEGGGVLRQRPLTVRCL